VKRRENCETLRAAIEERVISDKESREPLVDQFRECFIDFAIVTRIKELEFQVECAACGL
jgi:hypothetical protein